MPTLIVANRRFRRNPLTVEEIKWHADRYSMRTFFEWLSCLDILARLQLVETYFSFDPAVYNQLFDGELARVPLIGRRQRGSVPASVNPACARRRHRRAEHGPRSGRVRLIGRRRPRSVPTQRPKAIPDCRRHARQRPTPHGPRLRARRTAFHRKALFGYRWYEPRGPDAVHLRSGRKRQRDQAQQRRPDGALGLPVPMGFRRPAREDIKGTGVYRRKREVLVRLLSCLGSQEYRREGWSSMGSIDEHFYAVARYAKRNALLRRTGRACRGLAMGKP